MHKDCLGLYLLLILHQSYHLFSYLSIKLVCVNLTVGLSNAQIVDQTSFWMSVRISVYAWDPRTLGG